MSEAETQEMPASISLEDSPIHSAGTNNNHSNPIMEKQLRETIDEIVILQSYARSVGKQIPENVLSDLSTLVDRNLNNTDKLGETLKLALSVHGGLSQVIAPISVRSLKATDPNQGLLSWMRQVWAIPVIFIFTLLAFVFFVYHSDLTDGKKTTKSMESPENR